MHLVLFTLLLLAAAFYCASIWRNKVRKANQKLAAAETEREAAKILKKTTKILESINKD